MSAGDFRRYCDDRARNLELSTMGLPAKPRKSCSLVLRAPDVHLFSSIVTNAVSTGLEYFLLDFANMEEATDDHWYYDTLRESIYDSEGNISTDSFLTHEEWRGFNKDPIGQMEVYSQATQELFEKIIDLNKVNIELLYESINTNEVDVIIYRNTIVLHVKGTLP